MQALTFTLPDAKGVEHDYFVKAIPANHGMGISMKLMGMISAPALGALGAILTPALTESLQGASFSSLIDDPELFARALGGLQSADLAATGAAVGALLQNPQNVRFLREQILGGVVRDKQLLDNVVNFDQAFTQNYGELYALIVKVIDLNGFFAVPSTWHIDEPSSPDGQSSATSQEADEVR